MKIMKNKFKYLFILNLLLFVLISNINAVTMGLSINKSSVNVGDSFVVTISGINGRVNISSSGNISLNISGEPWVEGSMEITGTANSVGTGTITVTPVNASTTGSDPQKVDSANSVSINVVEPPQTNNNQNNNTNNNNNNNANNNTNTKSNNANLKSLFIDQEGLSPMFSSVVTSYTLTVPESVTSLKITPVVEQAGAKYWITGDENLEMGNNVVTITVTAPDGTKKVYTINVSRVNDVNKADASLKSLIIDGVELKPEFSPDTLEYDLGNFDSSIEKLTILAFANSDNAKVEIQGNSDFKAGENIIKVIVTAEDGTTTREYSLKFLMDEKPVEIVKEEDQYQYVEEDPTMWENFLRNAKKNKLLLTVLLVCILELVEIIVLYKKLYDKNKNSVEENYEANLNDKDTEPKRRRGSEATTEQENVENSDVLNLENIESEAEKTDSENDEVNEVDEADEISDEEVEEVSEEEVNQDENLEEEIEESEDIENEEEQSQEDDEIEIPQDTDEEVEEEEEADIKTEVKLDLDALENDNDKKE